MQAKRMQGGLKGGVREVALPPVRRAVQVQTVMALLAEIAVCVCLGAMMLWLVVRSVQHVVEHLV